MIEVDICSHTRTHACTYTYIQTHTNITHTRGSPDVALRLTGLITSNPSLIWVVSASGDMASARESGSRKVHFLTMLFNEKKLRFGASSAYAYACMCKACKCLRVLYLHSCVRKREKTRESKSVYEREQDKERERE